MTECIEQRYNNKFCQKLGNTHLKQFVQFNKHNWK